MNNYISFTQSVGEVSIEYKFYIDFDKVVKIEKQNDMVCSNVMSRREAPLKLLGLFNQYVKEIL